MIGFFKDFLTLTEIQHLVKYKVAWGIVIIISLAILFFINRMGVDKYESS